MDKTYEPCEMCGRWRYLAPHHVFFGTANRKISEKYGMVINVCDDCHRNGPRAIHKCIETNMILKQRYQQIFEKKYSRELFMKLFRRNWLC